MTRSTDERTAPDTVSGAVLLDPPAHARRAVPAPVVTEGEFWRAVAVTVLGALRLGRP